MRIQTQFIIVCTDITTKKELSVVYNKSEKTIRNWIRSYDDTGKFERATRTNERKFTETQRNWLCEYYNRHPLAYLDEPCNEFKQEHGIAKSKSSVRRIFIKWD